MKSKWWLAALLVCLALAVLSPLASSSPDGLERIAGDQGFEGLAQEPPFRIIADYLFPGIHSEIIATVLAGVTGTLILFAIVYALSWLLVLRTRNAKSEA